MLPPSLISYCQYCCFQSYSSHSCLSDIRDDLTASPLAYTLQWLPILGEEASIQRGTVPSQPGLAHLSSLISSHSLPNDKSAQLFAISQTLSAVPHPETSAYAPPSAWNAHSWCPSDSLLAIFSPSLETHTKEHGIRTSWVCEDWKLLAPGPKLSHRLPSKAIGSCFLASLIQLYK